MADAPEIVNEGDGVKDTDIVFDCPKCGKSLAIDYRGAGLTISCSDCHEKVQVPIPEWMELGDLDSSEEEQEIRILNLRRTLAAAEFRIEQMEERLSSLAAANEQLEHQRQEDLLRFASLQTRMELIQQTSAESLKELTAIVPSEPATAEPPTI